MSLADDIAKIAEQEAELVFERFSEDDALAIGLDLRNRIAARGEFGLIDIRLWDRQLFAFSMPGASADNAEWVRRKINTVKRFQVSSYRKGRELEAAGRVFEAAHGMDPMQYAAAGGCFPIRMKGGPIAGCITVSGLPQRDDHGVVVEAICAHLGIDASRLAMD
jgi:uncharacterized protein (UPF0303 family)